MISEVLVAPEGHGLELPLGPAVEGERAHLRDLHAQVPVQARTRQTYKDAIVH